MIPERTVSFIRIEAHFSASSILPLPMICPSRIPPPLATEKHSTVPKVRTSEVKELAATMSVPRNWPMITEYIEKARPQETSFRVAGIAIFRKSRKSSLLRINIYESFSLTSLLRAETTSASTSSTPREIEVARATPAAPSFGAPKRPKMNTAFSRMFRVKATVFSAVLIPTRPTERSAAR